jgi:HSP20 family protein
MTGDPFAAVAVSVGRILGVFAGVGVGVAVTHIDLSSTARVAVALLAGTLIAIVLKVGDRPNLEVPIAALFLIGFAGGSASELGMQRIWETAVGAVVAVVVATLLWPPDPIRELIRRLGRLRQALAADFAAIADDLATGSGATADQLDEFREHSLDAVRHVFELEKRTESTAPQPTSPQGPPAVRGARAAHQSRRARCAARARARPRRRRHASARRDARRSDEASRRRNGSRPPGAGLPRAARPRRGGPRRVDRARRLGAAGPVVGGRPRRMRQHGRRGYGSQHVTRRDVDKLHEEIEELFADLWQVPRFSGIRHGFRPNVDCFHTDEPHVLTIVVELPGVDQRTVQIIANERLLVVAGERKRPKVPGRVYQQMEIETGPFQRQIRLAEDVDAERARAWFELGVLTIELPVAERSPRGRIAIRVEEP